MVDNISNVIHKGITVKYETFEVDERNFTVKVKGKFEIDSEIIKISENGLTEEQYAYFGRQFLQKLRNSSQEKHNARYNEIR